MRLIDRDALNEMLSAMLEKIGVENITWDDAMATIDHADDVDAVPVIRCKDCKHWECDDNESYCRELGIFDTDMNSYCSYAKRKEE